MAERFPMTPACRDKLRAEHKKLKDVDRLENAREIEAAREHGDLRENAEYHAAKERQGMIDARIRYLESRIGNAVVIDPAEVSETHIGFGATVTLMDLDNDTTTVYAIVGEDEAEVARGRINIESPIAKAMLGKSVGDEVVVRLPKGDRTYEVEKVEYKALT